MGSLKDTPSTRPKVASVELAALAQRLEELKSVLRGRPSRGCVGLWSESVNHELAGGGLGRGLVHEWLGVEDAGPSPRSMGGVSRWTPAISLFIDLVFRCCDGAGPGRVAWVGRAVWPYPAALLGPADRGRRLSEERSLFVRAPRSSERLWATEVVLRSSAASVVVADGSGLDLAATRRLQLAAEAGLSVCLLARPGVEVSELSASATRWLVSRAVSAGASRRWTVELLRCKGVQPAARARSVWVLEQDRATRAVRVAADVLDRSRETAHEGGFAQRTG